MARFDGEFFRECKMTNEQHNKFVRSNKMLEIASEPVIKDFKGMAITQRTCRNCGAKKCIRMKRVVVDGVASIGVNTFRDCDKWEPKIVKFNDPKDVKKLMKSFKKGII